MKPSHKNPHAVALGHLGGAKGGRATAASRTEEERSEYARAAALARWAKPEWKSTARRKAWGQMIRQGRGRR